MLFFGIFRVKFHFLDVYSARDVASLGTRDVSSPVGCWLGGLGGG